MRKKRARERNVVLPWEHRGDFFRWARVSRVRPVLFVLAVVTVFVLMVRRDRTESGIRVTRASLLVVRKALDSYRADYPGQCPPDLGELERKNYINKVPLDAWGRPFYLTCPGRFDPDGYELTSAGPDGIPGGLDRVE